MKRTAPGNQNSGLNETSERQTGASQGSQEDEIDLETRYPLVAIMNRNMQRMGFPLVRFGSKKGFDESMAATLNAMQDHKVLDTDKPYDDYVTCRYAECLWTGHKSVYDRHAKLTHQPVAFCAYHVTRTVVPIIWYNEDRFKSLKKTFDLPVFQLPVKMIKFNYMIFEKKKNDPKTVMMEVFKLKERKMLVDFLSNGDPIDSLVLEIRLKADKWLNRTNC